MNTSGNVPHFSAWQGKPQMTHSNGGMAEWARGGQRGAGVLTTPAVNAGGQVGDTPGKIIHRVTQQTTKTLGAPA